MTDVIRIIIKGGSGYGPVDEAYSDKVTINRDSGRLQQQYHFHDGGGYPSRQGQ